MQLAVVVSDDASLFAYLCCHTQLHALSEQQSLSSTPYQYVTTRKHRTVCNVCNVVMFDVQNLKLKRHSCDAHNKPVWRKLTSIAHTGKAWQRTRAKPGKANVLAVIGLVSIERHSMRHH